MDSRDLFGANKRKVRDMDTSLIERHFKNRKGELRYLGLPASTLTELIKWQDYFAHFSAVERGNPQAPYILQHNLVLTAFQSNLASKLSLLRGDIDDVLIQGADSFGNTLQYPYDVVSLDYSGGLLYKDASGTSKRVDSIRTLIAAQAAHNQDFLLFISVNTDNHDNGEIRTLIETMGRDLSKLGVNIDPTIQQYLRHPLDEARLKLYVPYVISQLSTSSYDCELMKPIYYSGNRDTRMMHFAFYLVRTRGFAAGKPSRQTFVRIINLPVFECADGQLNETDFGIQSVNV